VAGGPFDKFTGQWHLAGRFVAGSQAGSPGGTSGGTGGGTGGGVAAGSGSSGGVVPVGGSSTPASGSHATASHGVTTTATSGPAPQSVAGSQQLAASSVTITREKWQASWWLIVLTLLIAIVGFAALELCGRPS